METTLQLTATSWVSSKTSTGETRPIPATSTQDAHWRLLHCWHLELRGRQHAWLWRPQFDAHLQLSRCWPLKAHVWHHLPAITTNSERRRPRFVCARVVLFINSRVRKIGNEASSCSGTVSPACVADKLYLISSVEKRCRSVVKTQATGNFYNIHPCVNRISPLGLETIFGKFPTSNKSDLIEPWCCARVSCHLL